MGNSKGQAEQQDRRLTVSGKAGRRGAQTPTGPDHNATARSYEMATQENIKPLTERHLPAARDEASMDLGRAWGLATTLCYQANENPEVCDTEGVMCVVFSLVEQALEKLRAAGFFAWREIGNALAVCNLVRADSKETQNAASRWALEAVPSAIQRAKDVVDGH